MEGWPHGHPSSFSFSSLHPPIRWICLIIPKGYVLKMKEKLRFAEMKEWKNEGMKLSVGGMAWNNPWHLCHPCDNHFLREPHKNPLNPLNRSAGTCLYTTYRFAMIERIERIYLLNLPNLPNHPQRGLVIYKLDRKRSIEKIGKIFQINVNSV